MSATPARTLYCGKEQLASLSAVKKPSNVDWLQG